MDKNRMTAGEVRRFLQAERIEALDTRDPIAIRLAHGRWSALEPAIRDHPDDVIVDLNVATVGVKLAAEALGYTPQQVRKLIREHRLAAHKKGDQWHIPLKALL
ncbi:MAG: helix-turn-helix domain-containing protein [Chloroflexia bacterium]|nr:helix-turn-helix domain-containing protein [Chloroflexia bacterium]